MRTVLQEERRDEGVPRPKARQVFTFDLTFGLTFDLTFGLTFDLTFGFHF